MCVQETSWTPSEQNMEDFRRFLQGMEKRVSWAISWRGRGLFLSYCGKKCVLCIWGKKGVWCVQNGSLAKLIWPQGWAGWTGLCVAAKWEEQWDPLPLESRQDITRRAASLETRDSCANTVKTVGYTDENCTCREIPTNIIEKYLWTLPCTPR